MKRKKEMTCANSCQCVQYFVYFLMCISTEYSYSFKYLIIIIFCNRGLFFVVVFLFCHDFEANLTKHGISFKHQPRPQGQPLRLELPVFVTCRPGECGGRTCFARWTFKFVSRIVVVSCRWDWAFKFMLNKNLKVFFGLENLIQELSSEALSY